jgi:dipeptidyl aminopeptidase/acylaminoacyl peptidase
VSDRTPRWEQRFRASTPTFPTWSRHAPDRLVYVSNESGSYQAYAFALASRECRRLSDEAIGIGDASPSADGLHAIWFRDDTGDESGRWVSAPAGGGAASPLVAELAPGWPAGVALGTDVVVVGRSDRDGYAIYASIDREAPGELYRSRQAATVSGAERGGFNLAGLSTDGRLACIEHSEHGDDVRRALRVVDVRSAETVGDQWDGVGRGLVAMAWSPVEGDSRLALRHERQDRERPAIWDLEDGSRRDIEVDLPGDVTPLDWWPDGSALLVTHLFEGRDQLMRLEIDGGALEAIEHPRGKIDDARVRPDGEVWLAISSGGSPRRIFSEHGRGVLPIPDPPPEGAPFEAWHFTNAAGEAVHGFVAKPHGPGPWPVVMLVHGGPTWLTADEWHPQTQAFVDHGFAVGMVNYRGSTGYGRSWRDSIIGNIGFPEEEDVIAGLDALIAEGVADGKRAVIGGWSWGGYITLLSIGRRPQRWRAAVGGVPVGDYEAGYDELSPDLQAYDRYLLGGKTPHEVPELMAERSPISYASRVRTPTLVLVGRNDTRCPYGQAIAWVDAVRANGGAVEVYEYDSGHSSHDVDEVVRQMRAVLEFLARHVGD